MDADSWTTSICTPECVDAFVDALPAASEAPAQAAAAGPLDAWIATSGAPHEGARPADAEATV